MQHLQRQLSSSYISQNSQISQLSQNYNRNKFSQTPQQKEESSIFHQQRKISPLTRERDQHHKNKEQNKVNFQQINSKWLSIIQKPEIGYASANNNNKSLHQHQEDFDKNNHQNVNQTISHINNNNNNHKNNENNNILEIQANSYQQRNKFIKNLQYYIQQQQIKGNQIFSQISFDPKINELD
ncbi:hypothetical protein PPERSA_00368 [Pseudocohnilembus persalinus]|uniref:Uncharacterized protein n=1 Tax=Pseudocohnilembus persalinus TaxID=266149 RepID=A0A0V0QY75_PSEPJ|nr:hypothetical protein PPERSA_00368 [Pseudocohnilembus persalinus]|eukprot:KRX07211.1 hypothetical protein PPERSA_00368 [Pseudocohnilembus persalinus]